MNHFPIHFRSDSHFSLLATFLLIKYMFKKVVVKRQKYYNWSEGHSISPEEGGVDLEN